MTDRPGWGIAIVADVVASRRDAGTAAWLRELTAELDRATSDARLAPFGFTRGDELEGLLRPTADPFAVVLRTSLRAERRTLRWAIAAGPIDPGTGPATERTGEAFVAARELLAIARRERDALVARSGDQGVDRLLADLAPVLGRLLAELTPRQRAVARRLLVLGESQAAAARALGVSRPTISVTAARARTREIERLARALARLFAEGVAAAASSEVPAGAGPGAGSTGGSSPAASADGSGVAVFAGRSRAAASAEGPGAAASAEGPGVAASAEAPGAPASRSRRTQTTTRAAEQAGAR